MTDREMFIGQFEDVFSGTVPQLSNIRPSDWTEKNVIMPGKPYPGPFRYSRTPYTREIVDCLAPDHPARWVAVMKGAQVGFSSGVIMPGVGWLIKNNPGNAFITVGAPDLIEKAMEKLDLLIDNAGLRPYIKPQVQRNRANKSGDTNFKKEFPGGYVTVASANNHKAIRQVDLQYGFFDDFESIKSSSKESGSTRKLLEQRFAAYADTHKIFYISTPELKQGSNIQEAYDLGDKRKYKVPCPCCGEFIDLVWSIKDGDITGGITWKTDNAGKLIAGSVGYICQSCGGFFDDKNKNKLINEGYWEATQSPSKPGYFSYHLSSLYAPIGMYDWEHYVNDYLEANPIGQPRKEDFYKSFVNLCLGEPYSESTESPKANAIQRNTREYEPMTIPEKLSMRDGNGRIVLLTCAADMNGKVDDARLDYEILAWSETGANYSVAHGSIGTFIPREGSQKVKADRERWTYEPNKSNSVWPAFNQMISKIFVTDTGRQMTIFQTGLDSGHYTTYAYDFIDTTPHNVIGLKGEKEDRYIRFGIDVPVFKPARERGKLFILQVGLIKDDLSEYMNLRWSGSEEVQPANFMNFPTPESGMYGYKNYFEHFESEHRIIEKNTDGNGIAAKWQKKSANAQNHMWDCRVYNMAVREIIVADIAKQLKEKSLTWREVAAMLASFIK